MTSLVLPNFLRPILRFSVSNKLWDPCRSWLIAFSQSLSGMLCLISTWHPGMKAISIKHTATPVSLSVYYTKITLHCSYTKYTTASSLSYSVTHAQTHTFSQPVPCPTHPGCTQLCAAVWVSGIDNHLLTVINMLIWGINKWGATSPLKHSPRKSTGLWRTTYTQDQIYTNV